MKKTAMIVFLFLLLAALLISGTLLYQKLSSPPAPAEPSPAPAAETAPPAEPTPAPAEPTAVPAAETELPTAELTADFEVIDENGESVKLSDYFGEPIVVNFWATWCPPCREELPYFDAACKNYEGRVRFLMVDLTDGGTDTVESATAFAREENGYAFPLYFDVNFSGVEAYAVNAIPVTLFIRADGTLMHQQIGSMDEATLQSYIEQLLA